MEHKPIKSSMISSVAHENNTLEIEFKSGKRYQYEGISEEIFNSLINADSPGRFFIQNIKNSNG